jgi:hypothetical protein
MQRRMFAKVCVSAAMAVAMILVPGIAVAQAATGTVLKAADTEKILPEKVYYKGLSATTQLRNSGGIKFSDGYYILSTMVDTSGYSSDVQAKYQAYFITEVPIKIGGHDMAAGIYGIGFVGEKLIVTDVGAHDLFTVPTVHDTDIKRPTPLQVIADPAGGYRLYSLRHYVVITR